MKSGRASAAPHDGPPPAPARSARAVLADLDTLRAIAPEALQREAEAAWAALDGALRAVPHDLERSRAAMAHAIEVRARVTTAVSAG